MSITENLSYEYLKTKDSYVLCETEFEWLRVNKILGREISVDIFRKRHSEKIYLGIGIGYDWIVWENIKYLSGENIFVPAKDFILANQAEQQTSIEMDTPAEISKMDFSEALKLLKAGQMLQRNSWDINKYVIKASINIIHTQEPHNMNYEIEPAYYTFVISGNTNISVEPYMPNSKDLNAEDWVIRNERLNKIVEKIFIQEK